MPRIDGFGGRGTFVVRSAEDALSIRAFAQREWCREALIAGGGLLGLEAGYALHKLGLHASILERSDRLLRRQLDARASEFLRRYLEGLGMSIVTGAETAAALGDERLSEVLLRDGRALPADMLLVCAGITPNVRARRRGGARRRPRRARRRHDDHERPRDLRGGRRRRAPRARARAVAGGGRAGRGGGVRRARRGEGLRRHGAGDDPQGRRDRADLDRPLRARGRRTRR